MIGQKLQRGWLVFIFDLLIGTLKSEPCQPFPFDQSATTGPEPDRIVGRMHCASGTVVGGPARLHCVAGVECVGVGMA